MFEEFKETLRRVLLAKYSIGFIDGYETGKADGYTEGYTDGTKAGGFTDGYTSTGKKKKQGLNFRYSRKEIEQWERLA